VSISFGRRVWGKRFSLSTRASGSAPRKTLCLEFGPELSLGPAPIFGDRF